MNQLYTGRRLISVSTMAWWSLAVLLLLTGVHPLKAGKPSYLAEGMGHHQRNENSSYSRLQHDLLKNYDPLAIPVSCHGNIVNITLSYLVFQLVLMDESNEMMIVNSWINTKWTDEFMQWDREEYDGIDRISIPGSFLWLPDIAVFNGGTEGELDLREMSSYNVQVESNGRVSWWVKYIGKTPCAFDLASFPWDSQTCRIEIGPWVTDMSMIHLHPAKPTITANNSGSWIIEEVTFERFTFIYEGIYYARVAYDIRYQRKPLFYIFNFLMPSVLLALVSLASYLFPVDVTERVSLPVALFLSASFLLFATTNYMPIQSDVIPIMARILCKLMADILICVFFNVLVIKSSSWCSNHNKERDQSGNFLLNKTSTNNKIDRGENAELPKKKEHYSLKSSAQSFITPSRVNLFFFTLNFLLVCMSIIWLISWCV